MALFGPILQGDASITSIAQAKRFDGLLVAKTANFTIGTKEAYIFDVTTGTITATAPAANSTDLQLGSTFLLLNNTVNTLTVIPNTSGSIGTIAAGQSGMLILTGIADANGTWELIQLDMDQTGITKFSGSFNADVAPTANASWTLAGGANTLTIDIPTAMLSANPISHIFNANMQEVLVQVVNSVDGANQRIVISVPAGTSFAGTRVIF